MTPQAAATNQKSDQILNTEYHNQREQHYRYYHKGDHLCLGAKQHDPK